MQTTNPILNAHLEALHYLQIQAVCSVCMSVFLHILGKLIDMEQWSTSPVVVGGSGAVPPVVVGGS